MWSLVMIDKKIKNKKYHGSNGGGGCDGGGIVVAATSWCVVVVATSVVVVASAGVVINDKQKLYEIKITKAQMTFRLFVPVARTVVVVVVLV